MNGQLIPLYEEAISAGFPSPAEGLIEERVDLNKLLVKRPAATFFLRVSGSSMVKAGIHDKDIVIVDRSLAPSDGKIVVAAINGALTLKRLRCKGKKIELVAENEGFSPIEITKEIDLRFWGVVTSVIHKV
jgi:DNA polymerase V